MIFREGRPFPDQRKTSKSEFPRTQKLEKNDRKEQNGRKRDWKSFSATVKLPADHTRKILGESNGTMEHLMTRQLDLILKEGGAEYDWQTELEINPSFLDSKGKVWLKEIFGDLDGKGGFPLLDKLKFDFKIGRHLIFWDDELHFNRYRLATFRSEMYSEWTFPFAEGHKRLCRAYEKECLKAGMQARIWNGPPVAKTVFGEASESGDFSGNGPIGWKLQSYNDAQYDLQTRLHGYKLIRLSPYETLMTGGSLKRLDQLLVNPKEEQRTVLFNWLMRKMS